MKALLSRTFDRACSTYREAAVVQKRVARELSETIPDGQYGRILEIGCGGGFLHDLVRRRGIGGTYLALDIARAMLGMLADKGDPRLHLIHADGESCPVRPGSIDLLLSSSTLQWFDRPEASIPAILGLLRSGGRFAFALFVDGTLPELGEASRATGFGSVRRLRPSSLYTGILERLPEISFTKFEREQTLHLDSARSVLQHLKDTGVGHTETKRASSRRTYRSFIEYYESRFGADGRVRATYRLLFLHGVRKPAP
jgi:malonyl-CoA O-methyltransferase